jgi:hypothetical protein
MSAEPQKYEFYTGPICRFCNSPMAEPADGKFWVCMSEECLSPPDAQDYRAALSVVPSPAHYIRKER